MTLAESILADFQEETRSTAALLEAVPEDKFDFKPHPKSMSLGELAGHVAEGPSFLAAMTEPVLDFEATSEEFQPFVPTTKAALMAKLKEADGLVAKVLAGRDDAFMSEPWVMRKGEIVFMEAPRHAAMRKMGISHTAHHRGQLQVYLRLLDLPVPSVYGPTADAPMP